MKKIDANEILQERGADALFDELAQASEEAAKETAADAQKARKSAQNGREGASGTFHDKSIVKEIFDASTALFQQFRTAADYFSNAFEEDRARRRKFAGRKTGFENLDADGVQVFVPGLYIVGGLPAIGKTDFGLQWAAQCVANGEPVAYVSYEMDEAALRARYLARELFLRDPKTTLTATDIRFGGGSRTLEEIISFQKSLQNFHIARTNADVKKLISTLEVYISTLDKPPVIVLDYIQRIPSDNPRIEKYEAISRAAYALKEFQLKYDATIIALSALNRDNYWLPASEESFKMTGDLEYSADVLLALQLYCVNGLKGNATKMRKTFQRAKKHNPREMELIAVKNREGSPYSVFFDYHAAHSYFAPHLDEPEYEDRFGDEFNPTVEDKKAKNIGDSYTDEELSLSSIADEEEPSMDDTPLPF